TAGDGGVTVPGAIASFYTPDPYYSQHAIRLRCECYMLGLRYEINERPDAGGYLANCRQKPVYLLETLERWGEPLLWIDVDGSILKQPTALDYSLDFMARPKSKGKGRKWHVGTLFVNNTPGGHAFLRAWVDELDERTSDEAALDRLWRQGFPCSTGELPAEYFEISPQGAAPSPDTVVCHRLSGSASMHAKR